MHRWMWAAAGAILLLGFAVVAWHWSYLQLPGEMAVRVQGPQYRCLYLFKPGHLLGQRWTRITPLDVYAFESSWSPDGQQVVFRCSNGLIYGGQRWLQRPGESSQKYNPERDTLSNGLCLVDRQGENFRWLIDEAGVNAPPYTDFPWPIDWLPREELRWTYDGRYVVFKSSIRFDEWLAIDPVTGEFGAWQRGVPELGADHWYSDRSDIQVTQQLVARARGTCFRHWIGESWDGLRGSPSPDGRYLAWVKMEAMGTPSDIVVYDTEAERLLCVSHTADYLYDLVWLPEP